jgi:hypothetical protein
MDVSMSEPQLIQKLTDRQGIVEVHPLHEVDRQNVARIEKEVEATSLMGLGAVVNVGVDRVLGHARVFVALTDEQFDLGDHPSIVLKKGDHVVGEEIRDQDKIAKMQGQSDVLLLGKFFVVYKNRIRFPHDLVTRICRFELPHVAVDWCGFEDDNASQGEAVVSSVSAQSDVFLKSRYFGGIRGDDLGTILIGVGPAAIEGTG